MTRQAKRRQKRVHYLYWHKPRPSTPERFLAQLFELPAARQLRKLLPREVGLGRVVRDVASYVDSDNAADSLEHAIILEVLQEERRRGRAYLEPMRTRILQTRARAAATELAILQGVQQLKRLLTGRVRSVILDPGP